MSECICGIHHFVDASSNHKDEWDYIEFVNKSYALAFVVGDFRFKASRLLQKNREKNYKRDREEVRKFKDNMML